MTDRSATNAQVEALARYMDEAAQTNPLDTRERTRWDDRSDELRQRYLFVAREMLERTPAVLVEWFAATRREEYAGLALSRLAGQFADDLAGKFTPARPAESGAQRCARKCVEHADALLAELAKPKE